MPITRFFQLFPRFKSYQTNPKIQAMYKYMSTAESIEKMLTANDVFGLPALAGIVDELQMNFHSATLDFTDNKVRQLIGGMVKEVILDFGYETEIQKGLKGPGIIRSATHYKKNPAIATKILKKELVIEDIK